MDGWMGSWLAGWLAGWLVGWICSLAEASKRRIDTTTQEMHQAHEMEWQPYRKEEKGQTMKQLYPSCGISPSGSSTTAGMLNGTVDDQNSPVVANKCGHDDSRVATLHYLQYGKSKKAPWLLPRLPRKDSSQLEKSVPLECVKDVSDA